MELQEAHSHYIHTHCEGRSVAPPRSPTPPHSHQVASQPSHAKFGKRTTHSIASWSACKRAFVAHATADGSLSDAHIEAIALAGKTRSADLMRAARRTAEVVTPPTTAATAAGVINGGAGKGAVVALAPPPRPGPRPLRGPHPAPTPLALNRDFK